ncbi:response regulator [Clostridium fallax]|uniref:Transcriptional regulatory protein n=1 Tax=Clostridium fallax TaxID=1533 RepID=A0A1M4XD98_9CLOT|nr:response regulator [Clostridium fallax]SHE91212.1 two-component system, CitB family, response regulator/two-component system, CitB family, response regulator MalR [Clostridium fallax]SQB05978.1 two-component response regulator [Clostridium fallax]
MKNVLIVEDDPMVALINRKYVELIEGFKVLATVDTEKKIISLLDKEKIDLILLDVYLPKESGIEILKNLRDKGYLVDIIMITAANKVEEIKKAFAYGVIDYLIKPFEFDRFKEAIDKYLVKNSILTKEKKLDQKELDIISRKNKKEEFIEIPKGLSEKTLRKVISLIETDKLRQWTIREIAADLGISNVSIKKYMDYLEKIKKVNVTSQYGNVGRPEYKYTVNINY